MNLICACLNFDNTACKEKQRSEMGRRISVCGG
ncbi:hypothetical protein Gotur_008344 [Gossypium turneri]